MARFRRIDTRMWGDEKFRRLSPPPPSGQALWIYLLTGPHTTSLPGLFMAGEAALAEALRWPLQGFRKAFGELSSQGMAKADWEARVIWVPNAVKYNPPESPNVVLGWRPHWDEIAECRLKVEARETLRQTVVTRKGFAEAFAKAFGEGCGKTMPNQEQEQEQDIFSPAEPAGKAPEPKPARKPRKQASSGKQPRQRDVLFDAIADVTAADPAVAGSRIGELRRLALEADPPYTPEEVRKLPGVLAAKWPNLSVAPSLNNFKTYIGWVRRDPTPAETSQVVKDLEAAQHERRERDKADREKAAAPPPDWRAR